MTYLKSKRDKIDLTNYSTKIESEVRYLNVSGDDMNGEINMQSNKIINLGDPTNSHEACTKQYVDTYNPFPNHFVKQDNCIKVKTNICMDNKRIINLARPTDGRNGANKDYVDEAVNAMKAGLDTRYVQLSNASNILKSPLIIPFSSNTGSSGSFSTTLLMDLPPWFTNINQLHIQYRENFESHTIYLQSMSVTGTPENNELVLIFTVTALRRQNTYCTITGLLYIFPLSIRQITSSISPSDSMNSGLTKETLRNINNP